MKTKCGTIGEGPWRSSSPGVLKLLVLWSPWRDWP